MLVALMAIAAAATCACASQGSLRPFSSYDAYLIEPASDSAPGDVEWATYLYEHMLRRAAKEGVVVMGEKPKGSVLRVIVSLDPEMEHEYVIDTDRDVIRLSGRHKQTMLWLVYQFMVSAGAEDKRLIVDDLQPSMIDMADRIGDYDFEYRGIYTVANMNSDQMLMIASQNIDSDWGIWGHNLGKLFNGNIPEDAKALVNGRRTDEQLCLSSPSLFNAIERYVVDNYGDTDDDFVRLLIMPNDNELVCECDLCSAKGNTSDNSTPAHAALVEKVADRFPMHQVFMCAYLTSLQPPMNPLPSNAGVFISAITLPMKHNPETDKDFAAMVQAWQYATGNIYIWDYLRNFDDYLTPYPSLLLTEQRIRMYKDMGVKGVFLNGSAPIYSTLNYQETFTMAGLLIDTDLDAASLVHRFLIHYYPTTWPIIEPYYMGLEAKALQLEEPLPFYGGINDAVRLYLDPAEFHDFYHRLSVATRSTKGLERYHLNRLLTGLSFTGLELTRLSEDMYNPEKYQEYLITLKDHNAFVEMTGFRERKGDFVDYLARWDRLPELFAPFKNNALKGKQLRSSTPLDDKNYPLSMLTDGLGGFSSDYHVNWLINSADVFEITLPANTAQLGSEVVVSTLSNPEWRLAAPAKIELVDGGRVIASSEPAAKGEMEHSLDRLSLASASNGELTLRIHARRPAKIAIDEIIVK